MRFFRYLAEAITVTAGMAFAMTGCANRTIWSDEDESAGIEVNWPRTSDLFCHCLPSAPVPFERLTLMWFGPPGEVPNCPPYASIVGFEGGAGLRPPAPTTCPSCTCGPAFCELPKNITVSSGKCNTGATSVSFNPPEGWDGECDGSTTVAGSPVQSVTSGAPTISSCAPHALGKAFVPPTSVEVMARECLIGPPEQKSCDVGETCTSVPPDGFQICLFAVGGDATCPENYPDRHVMWDDVSDDRTCEPCSCGEQAGASCSLKLSVYGDAVCGQDVCSYSLISGMIDGCCDLPPGVGLQSKSAVLEIDNPGTCLQGGGNPVGDAQLVNPVTFCCQPERPVR